MDILLPVLAILGIILILILIVTAIFILIVFIKVKRGITKLEALMSGMPGKLASLLIKQKNLTKFVGFLSDRFAHKSDGKEAKKEAETKRD